MLERDSDALPQPELARIAAAEDCFGATGAAAGTAAVAAAVAAAGAARKAEADGAGAAAGCRAVAAPAEADAPLGRGACLTFVRSFRNASIATRETVSEAPAPDHSPWKSLRVASQQKPFERRMDSVWYLCMTNQRSFSG